MTAWEKIKAVGFIFAAVVFFELLILIFTPLLTTTSQVAANQTDAHSALNPGGVTNAYDATAGTLRAFPFWLYFIPPVIGTVGAVVVLRKTER